MKSSLTIKLFLLFVIVFSMHFVSYAQPCPACPPTNPPPPDVPITGIEVLIGAGLLVGARKILRLRNKR